MITKHFREILNPFFGQSNINKQNDTIIIDYCG